MYTSDNSHDLLWFEQVKKVQHSSNKCKIRTHFSSHSLSQSSSKVKNHTDSGQ